MEVKTMTLLAYSTHEPVAPTETEALLARETSRLLASHVRLRAIAASLPLAQTIAV
jgi:hypothetical protein